MRKSAGSRSMEGIRVRVRGPSLSWVGEGLTACREMKVSERGKAHTIPKYDLQPSRSGCSIDRQRQP